MNLKKGRPSKAEQIQIQKMIRPYFNQNLSAHFVSQLPNMPNEKTIQKYFNQWSKELSDNLAISHNIFRKNIIGKALAIFDKDIYNLAFIQNDLIQSHSDSKKFHEYQQHSYVVSGKKYDKPFKPDLKLIDSINKITKTLCELKDHKLSMELQQFSVITEEDALAGVSEDMDVLLRYKTKLDKRIREKSWIKEVL